MGFMIIDKQRGKVITYLKVFRELKFRKSYEVLRQSLSGGRRDGEQSMSALWLGLGCPKVSHNDFWRDWTCGVGGLVGV
jgi:hypothetical protein